MLYLQDHRVKMYKTKTNKAILRGDYTTYSLSSGRQRFCRLTKALRCWRMLAQASCNRRYGLVVVVVVVWVVVVVAVMVVMVVVAVVVVVVVVVVVDVVDVVVVVVVHVVVVSSS